jgi:hypothetical protein
MADGTCHLELETDCICNKRISVPVTCTKSQTCALHWCACFYRCSCGLSLTFHRGIGLDVDSYKAAEHQQWTPSRHSQPSPTDAYGTIEFQGGPHPSKAQVRATQMWVWSILLPIMTCFIHHIEVRTTRVIFSSISHNSFKNLFTFLFCNLHLKNCFYITMLLRVSTYSKCATLYIFVCG